MPAAISHSYSPAPRRSRCALLWLGLVPLFASPTPSVAVPATAPEFSHPGSFYVAKQFAPSVAQSPEATRIVTLADPLANIAPAPAATLAVPAYGIDSATQQRRVREFQEQARAVYLNALAYRLTQKPAYAHAAKRVLLPWVQLNREISGQDGPVVMNYLGGGFLIGADLVWDQLTPDERTALQTWTRVVFLRQAVQPELRLHQNNHRTWAIPGGLLAAFVLEDRDLFASYTRLLDEHIAAAIADDGSMPRELARGERAGWYTYFSLAPMLSGVQIVQNVTGEQLWDRHDRRLAKALDYLYRNFAAPDRLGAGTWMNPENLFEALAPVYPNQPWSRSEYLQKARPIDASEDQHIAWEFPTLFKAHRPAAASTGSAAPASGATRF